jgi:hypothetical protein
MSRDLDSWMAAPYSSFLRICSRNTLSLMRHHWQLYADTKTLLKNKHSVLFSAFTREFNAQFVIGKHPGLVNYAPARSSGVFCMDTFEMLSNHHKQYWRTGTVFTNPDDSAEHTLMNPTFVYSLNGEGCSMHCGAYPLQCFHLASAYGSKSDKPQPKKDLTIDDLIASAKLQFQEWCGAFTQAISPNSPTKITIRLFTGDVLAFCQTLYHYGQTKFNSASLSVSPWSGTELILDGQDYGVGHTAVAPSVFDVVDTSNIEENFGLLNALIAAVPLLARLPTSAIYTKSILAKREKERVDSFTRTRDFSRVQFLPGPLLPAVHARCVPR